MTLTLSNTQIMPNRPLSAFALSFYSGPMELQLTAAPSDPAGYEKVCAHIAKQISDLAVHSLFAREARKQAYKPHDVMDIRVTANSITFRKEGEPATVAHTMLVDNQSPLKPVVDEILKCANIIRSTTTLARTTTLASQGALSPTASLASLTAIAAPATLGSTLISRSNTPDPRLAQMDAQIQAQAATLVTSTQTIADRDVAIAALTDSNQKLQDAIDTKTAEITTLQSRIAPLEAELTAAKDRIVELERELSTATATIAENKTKLLELETRLTTSTEDNARLVAQTEALLLASRKLTEEKAALALKITNLEEQVKPLEEGILSLTANVEELINTNSDLRAANAALSEYLDAERETSRLVKADLALRDAQIHTLEAANLNQAAEARSLQDRVHQLELENDGLKALSRESSLSFVSAVSHSSAPDSGVDVEEFERKLEIASVQEDLLRQTLSQQEAENAELHAASTLLSTTIDDLKARVNQEEKANHALRLEADKRKAISAELAETKQLLEDAEAERFSLFARLTEQTATTRTLRVALQEASSKHAEIIAGFEAHEQKLEAANYKLTLDIKQKNTVIRDMQVTADKQADALQLRIAELELQHLRDEAIFRQLRVRHEQEIAQITKELDAVRATLVATEKEKADQDAEFATKALATIGVFTDYETRLADANKQIVALELIRDQAIQVGRDLGYIG